MQIEVWGKFSYFGADMNSSVHIVSEGQDILILGEGATQRLDDNVLTGEAIFIYFTQPNKRFYIKSTI